MRPTIMTLSMALGLSIAWALFARPVWAIQQETRASMTQPTSESQTARYSKSGHDVTPLARAEVERLAKTLDPETYRITQKAGTEAPFCGNLLDNKLDGVYTCVVCQLPLFSSDHKFTSGTGWPSFFTPYDPDHVTEIPDTSMGMVRTEIQCARCSSHLGHLFEDGPRPTGLRFCLNSASIIFHEKGAELPAAALPVTTETAYFAGGCFWGIEHYFQLGDGVLSATSGYMQGKTDNPTYEQIMDKDSGHAETVKVVFDPKRISYERLLRAFFDMHNPTQLNYQGPDYGTQYRSGIWTANDEQLKLAKAYRDKLAESGKYADPIVTQIEPGKKFWAAEDYHQDYIANTGRACSVKNPW